MPTLLLSRTCQPEAGRLAIVAAEARWHHQWLGRRRVPARLCGSEFGMYAETDIALRTAKRHGLALIEPAFDLLARLPEKYTRREIRYLSLGDALRLRDRWFIKPADCTNKAFDAAVCESGEYLRCARELSRDTRVLVSEAVSWDVEYRVIVLERAVATFSPYIRGGWLARDQEGQWPYAQDEAAGALSLCHELLADTSVPLPPAFTLDVGIIDKRGWAVVELNPVWCSGLLGCDLSKMLPVLRRACWKRDALPEADAAWVIDRDATAK